jgi:rRNA maturation protein Nop10
MEIAGSNCRLCGRTIVLASEGNFCPACGAYSHRACDPGEKCTVCGQRFQRYEPSKPDPMRDAFLPRALRPASDVGPLTVALALLIPAILFFLVWWAIMRAMAYGR